MIELKRSGFSDRLICDPRFSHWATLISVKNVICYFQFVVTYCNCEIGFAILDL